MLRKLAGFFPYRTDAIAHVDCGAFYAWPRAAALSYQNQAGGHPGAVVHRRSAQ